MRPALEMNRTQRQRIKGIPFEAHHPQHRGQKNGCQDHEGARLADPVGERPDGGAEEHVGGPAEGEKEAGKGSDAGAETREENVPAQSVDEEEGSRRNEDPFEGAVHEPGQEKTAARRGLQGFPPALPEGHLGAGGLPGFRGPADRPRRPGRRGR